MRYSYRAPRVWELTCLSQTTTGCKVSLFPAFNLSRHLITSRSDSPRQLLQDFLPQLLRLAKKFLVFEEQSIQFQRAIGAEALAQNHVAYAYWVRQDSFFAKLFEGGCGVVVVHGLIVNPARNPQA